MIQIGRAESNVGLMERDYSSGETKRIKAYKKVNLENLPKERFEKRNLQDKYNALVNRFNYLTNGGFNPLPTGKDPVAETTRQSIVELLRNETDFDLEEVDNQNFVMEQYLQTRAQEGALKPINEAEEVRDYFKTEVSEENLIKPFSSEDNDYSIIEYVKKQDEISSRIDAAADDYISNEREVFKAHRKNALKKRMDRIKNRSLLKRIFFG